MLIANWRTGDLAVIVATDPDRIRRLVARLQSDADDVDRALSDVRGIGEEGTSTWRGDAARTFVREVHAWLHDARAQRRTYDAAVTAMRAYADRVSPLHDEEGAVRAAAAHESGWQPAMSIDDQGRVTPLPEELPASFASPMSAVLGDVDAQWQRMLAHYRLVYQRVSSTAAEIRETYLSANARLLSALGELEMLEGDARGPSERVPVFATPISSMLSRAAANRARALRDLETARRSGDNATEAMLASLTAPGVLLLVYEPTRQHVVAVLGDPTAARHVAVYVPGVEDKGSATAVEHGMADIGRVWAAAGRSDSAVVYWKGYSNPGDFGTLDMGEAALSQRASEGGADLATFLKEGWPHDDGQSITLLGHSYGSLVVGKALAVSGARPTNVVVFGSPGMGVESVGELHLRDDQFLSARAPDDPVANGLAGHGKDPTAPSFGGTRIATNAEGYEAVSGHTEYLTAGSKSLENIARIIKGGSIQAEGPHAGDFTHDALRDGVLAGWSGGGPELLDNAVTGVANGVGAYAGVVTESAVDTVLDAGEWLGRLND